MTPGPTTSRSLRTRPNDLVAETLSDETLVIDTVTGVFFSLRGVASVLWSMLEGTTTDAELRAAVRDHFADAPSVDADVDAFVAALEADGLITDAVTPAVGETTATVPWPEGYEPPAVRKYDDMADLLLVDPIHDVAAETGWPDRLPEGP